MGKRIAIVGVGALGGYVGGWLAHTGEDVTLIDFWTENIETIRSKGLSLDGVTPEEKVTVKNAKTMHLTEMEALSRQKPIDIAFVSMKSYDTEWATALIKQYLAPDGFVVSLQNCLNEERIAGQVGWGKTVGMIASLISVDMYEPATIRRTVAKGGDKHTVSTRRWYQRRRVSITECPQGGTEPLCRQASAIFGKHRDIGVVTLQRVGNVRQAGSTALSDVPGD